MAGEQPIGPERASGFAGTRQVNGAQEEVEPGCFREVEIEPGFLDAAASVR